MQASCIHPSGLMSDSLISCYSMELLLYCCINNKMIMHGYLFYVLGHIRIIYGYYKRGTYNNIIISISTLIKIVYEGAGVDGRMLKVDFT